MTPDSRKRATTSALPYAGSSRVTLRGLRVGAAFLSVLGVVGTAIFVACSPPPIGWQGAGRDQTLPEPQDVDAGTATSPVDSGSDAGADADANADAQGL